MTVSYQEPTTSAELSAILDANHPKMIIYYTATWCGPCRSIAPVFAKIAEANPNIVFVKVDIDLCQDHSSVADVSSVPCFKAYNKGTKLDEFSGASQARLEQMAVKLN
eukprot:gene242-294_t